MSLERAEQGKLNLETGPLVPVAWTVMVRFNLEEERLSFLVVERTDGNWTFPGGKIEIGKSESATEAARREVEEETGITVPSELLTPTRTIRFKVFEAHPFLVFFNEFDYQSPTLQEPEKHRAWRWASLDELRQAVIEGRLPKEVIGEGWLETVIESIFSYPSVSPHEEIPAFFMGECPWYKREGQYRDFRARLLGRYANQTL